MSGCIILNDAVVHNILINLTREEILSIQRLLAESLQQYSVGEERKYQVNSSVSVRPNGDRTLFRPFTSPSSVGVKIMVTPVSAQGDGAVPQPAGNATQKVKRRPLQGIVALCDNEGSPTGVIDGKEITGYRTSLNALIGYVRRRNTANIVVFGAGKCAIWHIRLALALRGHEIKRITVVNRSSDTALSMIDQIKDENQRLWKSDAIVRYFKPSQGEYGRALESLLHEADVIFCTVLSHKILFPAHYITERLKGSQGPYISAVGSWQPDLIELDPDLLRYVVNSPAGYNPMGESGGAVIVDDRERVLEDTGEAIQSGLRSQNFVEWGEISDLENRLRVEPQSPRHTRMRTWLEEGFVVYKSIGVSITDLVLGNFLLSIAKERDLGVTVPGF